LINKMKILHANDDNHNLGGAFLITYRVEKYLRSLGFSYDYLSMDRFDIENTDFPISKDDKTYSANLRGNRLAGHLILPFFVNRVLKDAPYKIIHIDSDSAWKALLYAVPAKKNGVKVIVHSHSTGIDGDAKLLKRILQTMSKPLLKKYADRIIACSREAALWMAPHGKVSNVEVILNGVDFEKFYYDEAERAAYRNSYGIDEDTLVLGNVAMLTKNKNQLYLLDVLAEMQKRQIKAKLFLVGDAESDYGQEVKRKASELNLSELVVFTGKTSNVREHLNMMDIYLFPSFFEGAPLALYEAQATGLPCIINSTISKDAIACEWCYTESIASGAMVWCDKIEELVNIYRQGRTCRVLDDRFSIRGMASELSVVYKGLIN